MWLVQLLHLCALVVLHPILLAAPTTEGAREVDNKGNKSWLSTGALHSLYGSYRPEYWWFEIPLVLYRIFMVGILTVIRPGEGEQVAIGMTIEVFFIFVFLKLKPYKDPENGTLDVVGHVIILAWLAISSTRFDDSAVVTALHHPAHWRPAHVHVYVVEKGLWVRECSVTADVGGGAQPYFCDR